MLPAAPGAWAVRSTGAAAAFPPMTDAPLPAAPRSSKSRYREAPKKKGVPIVVWIIAGALVVVGAIWWFVDQGAGRREAPLPDHLPVASASGDVVAIKHAVKAGDVFETRAVMKSGVVMGAQPRPDGRHVVPRDGVVAPDGGGRLRPAGGCARRTS